MSGHTPGPWRVEYWNKKSPYIAYICSSTDKEYGQEIAVLYGRSNTENDARLIAAAPELLAMLRLVLSDADGYGTDNDGTALVHQSTVEIIRRFTH